MSILLHGALGTFVVTSNYGEGIRAKALCTDGKVRSTAWMALSADTFFSHPAAMRVRGKYIKGFLTSETMSGSSVATDDDPIVVRFVANNSEPFAHYLSNVAADCRKAIESAALLWSVYHPEDWRARP